MPEFTPEQMNQAVEKKGNEIFDMFFEVVNPQITDAVTQTAPAAPAETTPVSAPKRAKKSTASKAKKVK